MGHPAEPPWDPGAPSSWQLDVTRFVAALRSAEEIMLFQCSFGCEFQKPTTFGRGWDDNSSAPERS
eukprot:960788-Pyramimonas_sp.AAC.1